MMIASVFLSGITMATFAASGMFFVKFWRASGDRFFLNFAIACWLISVERVVSLSIHDTFEPIHTSPEGLTSMVYLIRLLAFGLIAIAMLTKNRQSNR